jgi:molybdenum cofactor synthesis domain-containing protein
MCDVTCSERNHSIGFRKVPLAEAVGMVLGHDITEIRKEEFKGRAFRKGHVVRSEDLCHLRRLGKEHVFVITIGDDEMHEDEAARELAKVLAGEGVAVQGEPSEGKINLVASRDGILKVNVEGLRRLNMVGDLMCATLHTNSRVTKGRVLAGTRAIPLVLKRSVIDEARAIADRFGRLLEVRELRKPNAGVVITGNEVYSGRIKDAFGPVIQRKIEEYDGVIVGMHVAPDDEETISRRLRELIDQGADLLVTTGGMSVDPDDVTRFAIRQLGATDITYGSAVLPGAMILIAYLEKTGFRVQDSGGNGQNPQPEGGASVIPIIGIPACGMYHQRTVLDLMLPRILAGERIGRGELAELGHGGLCLNCRECRFPVCPFGK